MEKKIEKKDAALFYDFSKAGVERLRERGIDFIIDGRACSCESIDLICDVFANENYMADYISDQDGHIVQVRFDHIQNE